MSVLLQASNAVFLHTCSCIGFLERYKVALGWGTAQVLHAITRGLKAMDGGVVLSALLQLQAAAAV